MGSGLIRFCRLLCALLAAGWAAPASAQAGGVGEALEVCVRRAEPGLDPGALLRRPTGFDCARRQVDWGPGDYLVVSQPLSLASHWPARVRTGGLWQDRVTLHALYADGAVVVRSMDSRSASRHVQLGAVFEQKLPERGVPLARLLWHVEGAANLRGILLDPRVAAPSQSARSNTLLAGLYGGFGGLCLALLFTNLALWVALRHRFQLAYCAMLAALLLYAASSSGALAMLWPGIDNNDRLRLNYLSLTASAIAAIGFARAFFERRVFDGRLGRLATFLCAQLAATAVLFALFESYWPLLFDRIHAASFALLMLIVPPVLWRAWAERSDYLRLFCVAWAAPILFASFRIAAGVGIVGWSFWLDNSTILAMVAEAVLSSLAVAYRINLLSRDRDRARLGETAALLLADTDPLTGLLNRRAFLRSALGRPGDQLLLLADIDHFKRVNDTIGHDAGDEVLRAVARAMAGAVPDGALVARLGGEEFAILAAADAAPDPAAVLDALRAEPMPFDLEVTASIGVAHGPLATETDWKALYRDADRALLDAKKSGRDRVRRAFPLAA